MKNIETMFYFFNMLLLFNSSRQCNATADKISFVIPKNAVEPFKILLNNKELGKNTFNVVSSDNKRLLVEIRLFGKYHNYLHRKINLLHKLQDLYFNIELTDANKENFQNPLFTSIVDIVDRYNNPLISKWIYNNFGVSLNIEKFMTKFEAYKYILKEYSSSGVDMQEMFQKLIN